MYHCRGHSPCWHLSVNSFTKELKATAFWPKSSSGASTETADRRNGRGSNLSALPPWCSRRCSRGGTGRKASRRSRWRPSARAPAWSAGRRRGSPSCAQPPRGGARSFMDGARPCAATTLREKRHPSQCMPMCDSVWIGFHPHVHFFSSSATAVPGITAAKLWRLSRAASLSSSPHRYLRHHLSHACLAWTSTGTVTSGTRTSAGTTGVP